MHAQVYAKKHRHLQEHVLVKLFTCMAALNAALVAPCVPEIVFISVFFKAVQDFF